MADRQMADESRFVGHDLTGVAGVLENFSSMFSVVSRRGSRPTLMLDDFDIDVLAAANASRFRIQSREHVERKTHGIVGQQSSRIGSEETDAANPRAFDAELDHPSLIYHLPEKSSTFAVLIVSTRSSGSGVRLGRGRPIRERESRQFLRRLYEKGINDASSTPEIANQSDPLTFADGSYLRRRRPLQTAIDCITTTTLLFPFSSSKSRTVLL